MLITSINIVINKQYKCNVYFVRYIKYTNQKTIALRGAPMAFKIPSIPPTTNKTIRFPNDLIDRVETLIRNRDCTFSAFVIAAVRAAVEEVEAEENK